MSDELSNETSVASNGEGASSSADQRLSRLEEFEVADGFPDIRGWAVRGTNGLEIGVVGELLVDTELLEVSAIDVHLGVGAAGVRGNVIGSARVPIEAVDIRPDRYVVVEVEVIPCDDVLVRTTDADGLVARVPCGQIGIRKRTDVEVPRAVVSADQPTRPGE